MWVGECWPAGVFTLDEPFPSARRWLPPHTAFAHCVSTEFSYCSPHLPAAGFAAALEEACGRPPCLPPVGHAAARRVGGAPIIELVTKARRGDKPSLHSLSAALASAVPLIRTEGRVVCIPMIGCGIDRLLWPDVLQLIRSHWSEFCVVVLRPPGGAPLQLCPSPVYSRVPRDLPRDDGSALALARERLLDIVVRFDGPWISSDPRPPLVPTRVLMEANEPDWLALIRTVVDTDGVWYVVTDLPLPRDVRPAVPPLASNWAGPRVAVPDLSAFPTDHGAVLVRLRDFLSDVSPALRRTRLVIDVASVRLPVNLLDSTLDFWLPPWASAADLWVRWEELASLPRLAVAAGRPEPLVSPQAFLSQRSCGTPCAVCDRHDDLYVGFFSSREAPLSTPFTRAIAFASLLARDAQWYAHPGSAPVLHHEESLPSPGDDADGEIVRSLLATLARSPRPPPSRAPPSSDYAVDALSDLRLPWCDPSRRPVWHCPSPIHPGDGYRPMIESLVEAVASGDAVVVPPSFARCTHLWFLVRQHGTFRPCVDLAAVSAYLRLTTVAYPAPRDLLHPSSHCGTSADARRAYRSIRISAEDLPYLCVSVGGVVLSLRVLWFGLDHGPEMWVRRFRTVLHPLVAGSPAASWVVYMDDVGISAPCPALVTSALASLIIWMVQSGIQPSPGKCYTRPAEVLRFLGLLVDFRQRALRISPSSAAKCLALFTAVLEASSPGTPLVPSARDSLRRALGKLSFFASAIPHAATLRCALNPFASDHEQLLTLPWSTAAHAELLAIIAWLPTAHLEVELDGARPSHCS